MLKIHFMPCPIIWRECYLKGVRSSSWRGCMSDFAKTRDKGFREPPQRSLISITQASQNLKKRKKPDISPKRACLFSYQILAEIYTDGKQKKSWSLEIHEIYFARRL